MPAHGKNKYLILAAEPSLQPQFYSVVNVMVRKNQAIQDSSGIPHGRKASWLELATLSFATLSFQLLHVLKLYTWLNFVVYKANVNNVVTEMKIKLSARKNYCVFCFAGYQDKF